MYPPQIVKVEFKKDFGDLEPLEFVFPRGMTAAQTPTIELACSTDSVYKGHLCSRQLLINHEGTQYFAVKGTKEEIECSGRGICEAAGKCACDANFASSNGEGGQGNRGDCGYKLATANVFDCIGDLPCSLRGVCPGDADYVCTCSSAFGGADCSLMNCPTGKSWFDAPIGANTAHTTETPCSSRGFCDTSTGVCTCQEGFVGAACDVLDCPTSADTVGMGLECSGHGSCMTMSELAVYANDNGVPKSVTYGTQVPNDPLTWDARMIKGCVCNDGWSGIDCAKRNCPTGDNPDTDGVNEIQKVSCTAKMYRDSTASPGDSQRCLTVSTETSVQFTVLSVIDNSYSTVEDAANACLADSLCAGIQVYEQDGATTISTHTDSTETHTFSSDALLLDRYVVGDCAVTLSFRGADTVSSMRVTDITNDNLAAVESWLESVSTLTDVSLSLEDDTIPLCPYIVDDSNALIITYEREYGDLPPIDVKPSLQYGTEFVVTTVQDCTKENVECSNKGYCDHTVGLCTCFPGFISSDGYGNRGTIQDCGHRSPFALALESEGGDGGGAEDG